MNILDFIFPKRCVVCQNPKSYLCENCFAKLSFDVKPLCLVCDKPTFNNLTHPVCAKKYTIDGCFSALSYNKTARKLIYSFKYKPYLTDLKEVLSELFYESIIQNENFVNLISKEKFTLIPVPLFSSKLRKRGYNQAEILANALSKKLKISNENILKRTKETKNQFKLSKEQREKNIKNAFELISHKSIMIKHKSIFLVDDIVTTGATLKEAANILKKAGAKQVFGLTLARD